MNKMLSRTSISRCGALLFAVVLGAACTPKVPIGANPDGALPGDAAVADAVSPPSDASAGDSSGPRTCASRSDCAAGEECLGGEGCGTPWTCQPSLGRACTADEAPFCGCDGRTIYGSSSCPPGPFSHRGACADAGAPDAPSGCRTSAECGAGRSCVFSPGCGVTTGVCQAQVACLVPNSYCGCDGATFTGCVPERPFAAEGACGAPSTCRRTGCSGELCAAMDQASACVWSPSFACYASARCERQSDGACGWTQTPELRACLANP